MILFFRWLASIVAWQSLRDVEQFLNTHDTSHLRVSFLVKFEIYLFMTKEDSGTDRVK